MPPRLHSVADASKEHGLPDCCVAANCIMLMPAGAVHNSESLSELVSWRQGHGFAVELLSLDSGLTPCMVFRGPPSWRA